MDYMRNAYKILVTKPEGKRPLGNLGLHGECTLKFILTEIKREG
jgi:hypothetical protein